MFEVDKQNMNEAKEDKMAIKKCITHYILVAAKTFKYIILHQKATRFHSHIVHSPESCDSYSYFNTFVRYTKTTKYYRIC